MTFHCAVLTAQSLFQILGIFLLWIKPPQLTWQKHFCPHPHPRGFCSAPLHPAPPNTKGGRGLLTRAGSAVLPGWAVLLRWWRGRQTGASSAAAPCRRTSWTWGSNSRGLPGHARETVTDSRWLTAATTKGRWADHLSCYSLYTLPQRGDSWAGRPRCWGLCYSWKSVHGHQFWPPFLSTRVVYSPLSESTAL